MRKTTSQIFIGVLLLAVGIGYLGNYFSFWSFTIFFPGWWTLFIIIPTIFSMIRHRVNIWNCAFLILGVWYLLYNVGVVPYRFSFRALWPVALILIGIYMIVRWAGGNRSLGTGYNRLTGRVSGSEDFPRQFALFGGSDIVSRSESLQGGSATAIFGGIELNLLEAKVNHDITVDAFTLFGGITITAPENCVVITEGLPLFGSFSSEHSNEGKEAFPRVTINCVAIFGGIDIK